MKKQPQIKINKSIFGITLLGVMLAFVLASGAGGVFSYPVTANAESAVILNGGDGSEASPYLINTAAQLDGLRRYLGKDYSGTYFKLNNDIDLTEYLSPTGAGYNGGKGWEPVGGHEMPEATGFWGNLDGGGFTVSGLWINRPDEEAGLFGSVYGAGVKNLNIVLGEKGITGGLFVGGLIAYADADADDDTSAANAVESCSVKGNITLIGGDGFVDHLGGLFGSVRGYEIRSCKFIGTLTFNAVREPDRFVAGGIAGWLNSATIENCYVRITFAGIQDYPDSIGGLGGSFAGTGNAAVNCFAEIFGEGGEYPFFGGRIFFTPATVSVTSCYYIGAFDGDHPQGIAIDEHSKKLTPQDVLTKTVFTDWDFDTVWGFDKNSNLVLRTFGGAYDPPPPPDLTWLWITLGVLGIIAVAGTAGGLIAYRRKKTVIVKETVTETVEVEKEVPIIKTVLPSDLSKQERRVAELILKGKTRVEIAEKMKISEHTVRTYTARIFTKAGVDGQTEFITRYLIGE